MVPTRKVFAILLSLLTGMSFVMVLQNASYQEFHDTTKVDVKTDRSSWGHWKSVEEEYLLQSIKAKEIAALAENKTAKLSKLGRIVFLEEQPPHADLTKRYTILIWKYGKQLENRHIKFYSSQRHDPFEQCSVKNCDLSYEDKDLEKADIVVFHLHQTKNVKELPKRPNRRQIWAFLTDESPYHTFMFSSNNKLKDYDGLFNWSMTYRMDSDIPVPYGRTVHAEKGEKIDYNTWNGNKKQDVLIAVMISNCGGSNHRIKYIKELQKNIFIDIYGNCGPLKCPGHFDKDCPLISNYKFYIAFENSNCDEYITEKLWWNGYAKNTIPIVMGGPREAYRRLLPPQSYIHVDDFASPRDLAAYLLYLNNTAGELERFFTWKKYFSALNEHGYYGSRSVHYCRICEAMNYNEKKFKVYDHLDEFWSRKQCHPSWDEYTS